MGERGRENAIEGRGERVRVGERREEGREQERSGQEQASPDEE